jgi:hypothetical protein
MRIGQKKIWRRITNLLGLPSRGLKIQVIPEASAV